MLKSVEIKNKIAKLKEEIARLRDEGKVEDAYKKLDELKALGKELEIANELEKEDKEATLEGGKVLNDVKNIDANVVFNKLVLGKNVTEEEYEAYKNSLSIKNEAGSPGQIEHDGERGGYLVPEQSETKLHEFREEEIALKDYCNVMKVNTMSGKFPVVTKQNGRLIKFEELTEIQQSQILFAQQKWQLEDYGDIIPVSNTILQDTSINLVKFIGRQFIKKAVNTENDEILAIMKEVTKDKKVDGKAGADDIKDILNTKLDPAIKKRSVIFTNTWGFNYLDKLKDKNGRYLLSDSLKEEGYKLLDGRKIEVLDDVTLPNGGTKQAPKLPFYIGDLEEAVNFYDRMGVEIAISKEAGFTKNATFLRAIERFDVHTYNPDALVYLELTPEKETTATA